MLSSPSVIREAPRPLPHAWHAISLHSSWHRTHLRKRRLVGAGWGPLPRARNTAQHVRGARWLSTQQGERGGEWPPGSPHGHALQPPGPAGSPAARCAQGRAELLARGPGLLLSWWARGQPLGAPGFCRVAPRTCCPLGRSDQPWPFLVPPLL